MKFIECKVNYARQTGESGARVVKESYIAEAINFGEAEKRVLEHVAPYAFTEVDAIRMKVWNVYDIIEIPDGESWFKANVEFITITDNGKEVRKKQCFLVFDTTLKSARNTLESHLSGMDAKIVSIEETKIVELLRGGVA